MVKPEKCKISDSINDVNDDDMNKHLSSAFLSIYKEELKQSSLY